MSLSALALVLLAAPLHASRNIATKRAGGDHRFTPFTSPLTSVLWLPAALWFGGHEVPRWGWLQWGVIGLSAVAHLLYFNMLFTGYRKAELTVVYPLARGSATLWMACAAVLLLGESLHWLGALGVLAVWGGAFLIAGGPALWRATHDPARRARTQAGVSRSLITGATTAAYSVIDGYAIKVLAIGPVIFDCACNVLRVPLQLRTLLRNRPGLQQARRTQCKHPLLVVTLGLLAYILVSYALMLAPLAPLSPLSHVAPAREFSLLVAALRGGRLLGEDDRGLRLLGQDDGGLRQLSAGCIAGGAMALA